MDKITSRDNSRLKFARRVREGREEGQIFVEGVRLAEEALRSKVAISEAFISEEFSTADRGMAIAEELATRSITVAEVPEKIFRSLADTDQPQGIILIAAKPLFGVAAIEAALSDAANLPLVLFLEEINNPSNLGAVIRTAEAAGVAGVITSENSADAFSPKALRAAMGSSLRLPIWEEVSVEDVFRWSVERTLTVTAADTGAAAAYTEINWKKPRLLIFGSEAHGISDAARKGTKDMIRIPMASGVESLNLAVSCGIILFEARRQYFG